MNMNQTTSSAPPHPLFVGSSSSDPTKVQQGIRHGLRLRAGHGRHGLGLRLRPRRAEGEQAQGARPGGDWKVTWHGSSDSMDVGLDSDSTNLHKGSQSWYDFICTNGYMDPHVIIKPIAGWSLHEGCNRAVKRCIQQTFYLKSIRHQERVEPL